MAEPEWDEETRSLALALDDVDLCPVCSGPAYLCQDPANEFSFHVPPPVRCHRQTALLEAQKQVTEQTNPNMAALMWRTVLTEEAGP
jgi:hypothetical protein